MTVVDWIDLDDDEYYVKVDFVDLSSDEDSVEKDGNVKEGASVPKPENLAEAVALSPSNSEQDATATTSLPMIDHGVATPSLVAEEDTQPENQEVLGTSDVTKEATQSGNHELIAVGEAVHYGHEAEAVVLSSITARDASTSLLLTKQGAITLLLREDKAMPSGNQLFVVAVGSLSITERGAMGVEGDAGSAIGNTGTYNLHAHEEPEGDSEKNENCDFEAETEALCQEVSHDVLAMSLPPQDKEKDISRCGKFFGRKGKRQMKTSTIESNRQLNIVQSKGMPQMLYNGDSGFSVMGNVHNGTDNTRMNVLDGEVVICTFQGCSKTSQGNAKVRGSNGFMVEDCTNDAHGGTPLCAFHHSKPHKRCCAVIRCTKAACSRGRKDLCLKHGGGKRCKYDGCGKGAQGNTDFCVAHGGGRR